LGLVLGLARHRWTAGAWLAVASHASLGAAFAIGSARQMTLLSFGVIASAPQGRYLFVLAIPIVWLLLVGLWEAWQAARAAWGLTTGLGRTTASRWGVCRLADALLFMAAFALLGLMLPFYHG
jgi:hypothetical protein